MVDPSGPPAPISKRNLAIATAASLVIAAIGLTVVVLPQSYGIDPTGLGQAAGFEHTPPEDHADDASHAHGADTHTHGGDAHAHGGDATDQQRYTLGPAENVTHPELLSANTTIEVQMQASGNLTTTFTAEDTNGTKRAFRPDGIEDGAGWTTTFTAPFEGTFAWHLENPTNRQVRFTITITASGDDADT